MEVKFKVGDKVRIVKYGHLVWESKASEFHPIVSGCPIVFEDDHFIYRDTNPGLVGELGEIRTISTEAKKVQYSLIMNNPRKKIAWYNEEQLELVQDGH